MKTFFSPMLIALFFVLTTLSCNNEEIFSEDNGNTVVDPDTTENTDVPSEDTNDSTVDATLPCSFGLDSVQSGDTIVINCILDLGGQTVNLPSNVTIVYEGGDIINGTLNFSDNSMIDGPLLNSSLTLGGSKPQLKDTTFQFDPQRWGIVEGKVSDDVALNNKKILQTIIDQSKAMGITTFEIGAMDAFFKVDLNNMDRSKNAEASIRIPSDFHLKMSDDTFLRVQPNGAAFYTLFCVFLSDNTVISGGHLIGDRYEHDYAPVIDDVGLERNTHEWGVLLYIIGSENIEVDNIHLSYASGDGIMFHSEAMRNPDGTLSNGTRETNNVLVKNSTITKCRRNGISFLDSRNITIDNCIITDTGKGDQAYDASGTKTASSSGTAPKFGIDMEAVRFRNADGSLNEAALNENINIRNSIFTGNEAGDIVLFTCSHVVVENNYFDNRVGSFAADNVIIRNNDFQSRDPSYFAIGISSNIINGEELNHDFQIANNTITGYNVGIRMAGKNNEASNNVIKNCQSGIFLINNLVDSVFFGNTITSNLSVSYGYSNYQNISNLTNVVISNETISVQHRPINFIKILSETQILFKNCILNTSHSRDFKLYINECKNLTFDGNENNTTFDVINSENIILTNNTTN